MCGDKGVWVGGLIDDGSKAREIASGLARKTHRPIIGRRFSLGRPTQTKQRNAGENCVEEVTGLLRRSSCPCAPKNALSSLCARVVAPQTQTHKRQNLCTDKHILCLVLPCLSFCGPFSLSATSSANHPSPPRLCWNLGLANQSQTRVPFDLLCLPSSPSFSFILFKELERPSQRNARLSVPSPLSHPLVPLPHSPPRTRLPCQPLLVTRAHQHTEVRQSSSLKDM